MKSIVEKLLIGATFLLFLSSIADARPLLYWWDSSEPIGEEERKFYGSEADCRQAPHSSCLPVFDLCNANATVWGFYLDSPALVAAIRNGDRVEIRWFESRELICTYHYGRLM